MTPEELRQWALTMAFGTAADGMGLSKDMAEGFVAAAAVLVRFVEGPAAQTPQPPAPVAGDAPRYRVTRFGAHSRSWFIDAKHVQTGAWSSADPASISLYGTGTPPVADNTEFTVTIAPVLERV